MVSAGFLALDCISHISVGQLCPCHLPYTDLPPPAGTCSAAEGPVHLAKNRFKCYLQEGRLLQFHPAARVNYATAWTPSAHRKPSPQYRGLGKEQSPGGTSSSSLVQI